MSFFSKYGTVWFQAPNGQTVALNDLTRFARLRDIFRTDPRLSLAYEIAEGERPELLSFRLYDTVDYWWVVLLANNIVNMERQWPKTKEALKRHISKKYPLNVPEDVCIYRDLDGKEADPRALMMVHGFSNEEQTISQLGLTPVSILDYETQINDAKRNIIMVDPEKLNFLVKEIEDAFK